MIPPVYKSPPLTTSTDRNPHGWQARLSLGYQRRGARTVLTERRRHGPLAVQRSFHPEGAVCHNYLLHPPGGVVGGDGLQIDVQLDPDAHALITTPGAAKFYRSAGALASVQQRLSLAPGATLEWLPQENILFPGANTDLQTRIELQGHSRFLGWELHCLGRPVIDERFDNGHALLGLALFRDQRPLLIERLRITATADLDGATGLRGHPITATLIATPADREQLMLVRGYLTDKAKVLASATLVDDVLLLRVLTHDADLATRILRGAWGLLREPLLGIPPCPPRIWTT